MRRVALAAAVLALAACGRHEEPAPPPTTSSAAPAVSTATPPPTASAAAPPPTPVTLSTPSHCGGDGSYDKAVDCFRIADRLRFTMEEPLLRAEGELRRPRPGMERLEFRAAGGTWIGEATPNGFVWSHDGKHDPKPPTFTERVYQRVATWADPQKKEPSAQLTGTDSLRGEPVNVYAFTNAATGASMKVWVSKRDGRMLRMESKPLPQLADTNPEYTLDLE